DCPVGVDLEQAIVLVPREREQLFREGQSLVERRANVVEEPEPEQDRRLHMFVEPRTELSRTPVRSLDTRRRVAACRRQRVAETDLDEQLVLCRLDGLGKCRERLQGGGEVTDRLQIRRALEGAMARLPPVDDRLCAEPGFSAVVPEEFRLVLDDL